MMMLDAVCLPICLWMSYALRLSDYWPSLYMNAHWWLFPLIAICGIFIFSQLRVYRTILRYIGSDAIIQIIKATIALSLIIVIASYFAINPIIPRSIPLIFLLVSIMYVGGTRFFYRHYYRWIFHNLLPNEAIAIYGAGKAGVQIVSSLADNRDYRAVLFLDDDPHLTGSVVQGLRVYLPKDIAYLKRKYNLKRVILAMPSASRDQRKAIIERLTANHIQALTLPALSEVLTGRAHIDSFRSVEIEDLLGRDPVPPKSELLDASIKGQNILVTGAGGSIGSELCRQILMVGPKTIILFDNSEFNLYKISQELSDLAAKTQTHTEIHAILGSVTDKLCLSRTVAKFKIDAFYHAAAYKHVPIVEHNIFSGIQNNIIGTRNACDVARHFKVKRFVLISTDKAVRPTNIMGATKRIAELIIQAMAAQKTKTLFSMVRFGNVLGSSGSVVPLFRKQIDEGGPITVTHKDITRYFMTINEAALLVLQAGSMAKGGDVFVLDMGKEIRIYDMAVQMVQLSGLTLRDESNPDGDIEITISGLRPAEKIKEELLIGTNVKETDHPRIMRAFEEERPLSELDHKIALFQAAYEQDNEAKAIDILTSLVTGYQPDEAFHATQSAPALSSIDTQPKEVSQA
ncbi:MAG: polysaccharide biosynthesis protein [Cohaesibacter sp.]|nr:polysaccharide biosynthesis protein [Cohaesibacter sp.]